MKSILKLGIAALLALTPAVVFAAAGDAFFFSSSNTNPNAGTTITASGAGVTAPLYIWVTASSAANDITPLSTAQSPGGQTGTGSAALNLNGTLTTTTGTTIGTLQIYNPSYIGNTAVSINRWSAVSAPVSGGTSFSGLEASTVMTAPPPSNAVYPNGTITGLSRTSVGDPNYFPSAVVPGGSTGGAWLLGQMTFTVTATAGSSTIALSAGPLDVTKSGPSTVTVLTPQYSFGSGTVTVAPAGRTGDLVGTSAVFPNTTLPDSKIDAFDIDRLSSDIRRGTTTVATEDYRGATVGSGPDGVVNQNDLDRLVGSLVDINNGGIGGLHGTHYGDANLDRVVDGSDFGTLAINFGLNFGANQAAWAKGDFNGDGVVDGSDFGALAINFGLSGASGAGSVAAVPEPSTVVLLSIGSVLAVGAYRRKR